MSNHNLFVIPGYPRAVLANGIARYVCQLQRVTIKFCKSHGGSRGVREFIENDLLDFAKSNPNIVVYVKPRRHRSPTIVAEYLNGERKWLSAHCFSRTDVNMWLRHFKSQSGNPEVRLLKRWHTENPSIQGPWNPFLFRNPEFNITKFPSEKFSLPKNLAPTATDIIMEMFKAQNLNDDDNEAKKDENNDKIDMKA